MTAIETYRDDGPLARALGRLLGGALPPFPGLLVLVAVAAILGAVATAGDDVSDAVAGGVLLVAIVIAGGARGRPHTDRLRWVVPSGLRAVEYAGLLWIGALAGDGVPGAFALLAVIWFRHYDLVYRQRSQGMPPAAYLETWSLGWDGRLALGWVLLVTDALPAGFYVLAGLLAVLFAVETIQGWRRFSRVQRPVTYDDEEDEGQ